jgi:hypothetical protein
MISIFAKLPISVIREPITGYRIELSCNRVSNKELTNMDIAMIGLGKLLAAMRNQFGGHAVKAK